MKYINPLPWIMSRETRGRMKKYYLIGPLAVSIVLFAITSQVFAQPDTGIQPKNTRAPQETPGAKATEKATEHGDRLKGKPEHFRGEVVSIDATTITLNVDGSNVIIELTSDTRIRVPGTHEDTIQPGMDAFVLAHRNNDGHLVAQSVMAIPGRPTRGHFVGVVTAYAPGASISIQPKKGDLITFSIGTDIKILPEARTAELTVGSLVTIIAPRDVTNPVLAAVGIVVHPVKNGNAQSEAVTPTP